MTRDSHYFYPAPADFSVVARVSAYVSGVVELLIFFLLVYRLRKKCPVFGNIEPGSPAIRKAYLLRLRDTLLNSCTCNRTRAKRFEMQHAINNSTDRTHLRRAAHHYRLKR